MFRINSTTITGILLSLEDKLVSEMRRRKTNKPPQVTCILKFTDAEGDFKRAVERKERDDKISKMLKERNDNIDEMIRLREENERRMRSDAAKEVKISRIKKIKVKTTTTKDAHVVTISNKITDKCANLLDKCEREGMISYKDGKSIIAHAKTVSTYETKTQNISKEVVEEDRITSVEKSDAIVTCNPVFTYEKGIKCTVCNTKLTDVWIQIRIIGHIKNYEETVRKNYFEVEEIRINHLRKLVNNYSCQVDEHAMFVVDNLDYDKILKEDENDKLLLKEMERRLKQILGVDKCVQTESY
jgi:hypothetical protein